MIDLQTVRDFMYSHFNQVSQKDGGNHFLAQCPFCADDWTPIKRSFNLDYNNGVPGWNCFNCDEHGSFPELQQRLAPYQFLDDSEMTI